MQEGEPSVTPAERYAFRSVHADDEPFLDELYEGTRLEEVLGWGFDRAAASGFLRDQARMQRRAYAMQFPDAEHRLLMIEGARGGRLIVDARADELWVVDIAVSPARRRQGLGGWAIMDVQRTAGALGRSVGLLVDPGKSARDWYARLGFRATTAAAVGTPAHQPMLRMQWRPC